MLLKVASASFSCLSDSPCLLYPFIRDGRRGCLHVLVTINSASVVMYGCESWTVKKAERQRIDAFEL